MNSNKKLVIWFKWYGNYIEHPHVLLEILINCTPCIDRVKRHETVKPYDIFHYRLQSKMVQWQRDILSALVALIFWINSLSE